MSVPLLKIGIALFRQTSRPIVGTIKRFAKSKAQEEAKRNAFHQGFISIGRLAHRFEFRLNNLMLDEKSMKMKNDEEVHTKESPHPFLTKLNSSAAFNKGVEYVVEIFLFYGVLLAIAYYEIHKNYLASKA